MHIQQVDKRWRFHGLGKHGNVKQNRRPDSLVVHVDMYQNKWMLSSMTEIHQHFHKKSTCRVVAAEILNSISVIRRKLHQRKFEKKKWRKNPNWRELPLRKKKIYSEVYFVAHTRKFLQILSALKVSILWIFIVFCFCTTKHNFHSTNCAK